MKKYFFIILVISLMTTLSAQLAFAHEGPSGESEAEAVDHHAADAASNAATSDRSAVGSGDMPIQALDAMDAQASDAPADGHSIDASSDWRGVVIEISDLRRLTAKIKFEPSNALSEGLNDGESIRYSITHIEKKLTVFEEINKTASVKVLKITLWDGTKYEVKADLVGSDGKVIQNLGEAGFGLEAKHPTLDDQFPGMVVLFGISLIGLIAGVKLRKRKLGKRDAGNA